MDDQLLITADKAAHILGIGRSLFYEMNSSGRLGPMGIRLGRAVRWRRHELEEWVSAGCPSRPKWMALQYL